MQYVKKMKSVDFCVQGIAAGLPLRLRPELIDAAEQLSLPVIDRCKTNYHANASVQDTNRVTIGQMPSIRSNQMQNAKQGAT